MDTAEVTLRLDGGLAERLRRDPAERARYEAFLGLAAAAGTPAQVEQAARLFTASPAERQCLLAEMLDRAFGSEPALALSGGTAPWATAVCRALSADAPQAAAEPPSGRDEGRVAAVAQAREEGERAASARRSGAPRVPLGASVLLLLTLGGGTMALRYSATPQGPAFAGSVAEDRAGRPPGLPKPLGPGVVAPDRAAAGPEGNPASRPMASVPHMGPSAVRPGAPSLPLVPAVSPAAPTGPSPADSTRAGAADPDAPTHAEGAGREALRHNAASADALEPSAAPGALWAGTEAPPDPPEAKAPGPVTAVSSRAGPGRAAETGGGPEPPRAGAEGASGGPDTAGRTPPGPGGGDPVSRPAAAGRAAAAAVVVHHRAGSPGAERAARLVTAEVRGAGLEVAAVRAVPAVPARRVVRFGRGEDEAAAERLALRLRRRWPHPWRLEASVSPDPTWPAPPLEIWLPHR
jgi:hypothetical protein